MPLFIALMWLAATGSTAGWVLLVWVVYQAAKAQGHADGYFAGYSDAHEATVKKALSITEKDEQDLLDRAIEWKLTSAHSIDSSGDIEKKKHCQR